MANQVFPTKGNLIATKKSLELAYLGYDLMDKKRNVLIKKMMNLLDDVKLIRDDITDSYQTLPDKYNIVHAGKKITAEALRVVVTTNPERSAAIFEMEIKSSKPSAEGL